MTINKTWIISILLFILFLWGGMYLLVPRTLFPVSYSTLLYSSEGNLLGARIAPDGQWRFPATDSLPDKFITCLTTYEDHYFFLSSGDRRGGHSACRLSECPVPPRRQRRKYTDHAAGTPRPGKPGSYRVRKKVSRCAGRSSWRRPIVKRKYSTCMLPMPPSEGTL